MSQSQPLSILAPEYNNPLPSVTQFSQTSTLYPPISSGYPINKEDCKKPCEDLCKKPYEEPCKKPCEDPYNNNYGWSWLGALILWFIIFTVLFWLIFYSLKPSFVLQNDSNQVDTAKVLLAAVIAALILVIIIWLIKLAVTRHY